MEGSDVYQYKVIVFKNYFLHLTKKFYLFRIYVDLDFIMFIISAVIYVIIICLFVIGLDKDTTIMLRLIFTCITPSILCKIQVINSC